MGEASFRRVVMYCGSKDITTLVPAGYSTHLLGMRAGFEANGLDVEMVVRGDIGRSPGGSSTAQSRTTHALRSSTRRRFPRSMWATARDLRDLFANWQGNRALRSRLVTGAVVYERFIPFHSAATSARTHGCTYVLEINSPLSERQDLGRQSALDPLARRRVQRAIRMADTVVFVSTALKDAYAEMLGDSIDHGIVVPNAIFDDAPAHREIEQAAQLTSGVGPVVVFVGSMIAWHRVDTLLHAFARLLGSSPSVRLLLIGDGQLREEYEQLSSSLGIQSSVRFTGPMERTAALAILEHSTLAVCPGSKWYCSPVKIFEYAQAGCPMIGPKTAAVVEAFEIDEEIVVVDEGVEPLLGAMQELLSKPELRQRLSANARKRVLKDHSWTRAAERVIGSLEI